MSTHALWLIAVYLHILAAAVWIGGMLFLVLVVVPTLRDPQLRAQAPRIVGQAGRRFRVVGWAALVTLVATGVVQTSYRVGGMGALSGSAFWESPFGGWLALKLGLVALTLLLAATHDFWIGPHASRLLEADPTSPQARRWRRAASWMGRVNLLLGLAIVAIAVILVRGTG